MSQRSQVSGSLCSVVNSLIVSGAQARDNPSKEQGHLLSSSGQLKTIKFGLGPSVKIAHYICIFQSKNGGQIVFPGKQD